MNLLTRPDVLWACLTRHPEYLRHFIELHFEYEWSRLQYNLDVLIPFCIVFALLYGLAVSLEGASINPSFAPGARPRTWRVPAVFVTALAFFHFAGDHAVTSLLRITLTEHLPMPEALPPCLAAAWAAGMGVAFFRLAKSAAAIRGMARTLPAKRRDANLKAAKAACGLKRRITVKIANAGAPVASFGIFRSFIVIPADFTRRYSREERFAIYLHECIHIRNRDAPKRLCLALARCIFWFDPVMRHAARRMALDMELACDWAVTREHGVEPVRYAGLIVKAAAGGNALAPALSAGFRQTRERLTAILGTAEAAPAGRRARALLPALAIALALTAMVVWGGSAPPTYEDGIPADGAENGGTVVAAFVRNGVFGGFGTRTVVSE